MTFLGIVMGYIADYITYGYEMQLFEIVGASLIVSCSVIVFALKIVRYSD